jgi:hypothetical protein
MDVEDELARGQLGQGYESLALTETRRGETEVVSDRCLRRITCALVDVDRLVVSLRRIVMSVDAAPDWSSAVPDLPELFISLSWSVTG